MSPEQAFGWAVALMYAVNAFADELPRTRPDSPGTVCWDGALTTLWWADPKEDLVVVAMTQWLDSGPDLTLLRPQVRALVYGALIN